MKTVSPSLLALAASAAHMITVSTALSTIPSLSDDYAAAQQRRALQEEELLRRPGGDVELPYFDINNEDAAAATTNTNKKTKRSRSRTVAGAGFGAAKKSQSSSSSSSLPPKSATRAQKVLASSMADAIRRDGVIRLPSLLTETSCRSIRAHVLKIESDVAALARHSAESLADDDEMNNKVAFDATDYYGVEPGRTCRTDLLLPLDSAVQGTLSELLAVSNPLRHLLCELFPLTAPLYEIAAVITTNGSHRQTIHPDLPHKEKCPLYVVFVALQDVTADMGPTTFLRGTQDSPPPHDLDDTLTKADVVVSTLKAGDAAIFDARVLHCGNANTGATRALFNFSFRRPDSGELGYEGSIRKGYVGRTTLGELLEVADNLNGWGDSDGSDRKTLESVYGNGLLC